jgi:hypothetical protein
MSVIDDLRVGRGFTATDRSIADYILKRPDEATRMTIGEIARATYTSNAAIVRLCRKVGLAGFRDLKIEVTADLERRRNGLAGIDADRPFTERESCATMIAAVAQLMKESIDTCYATISPASIEAIAHDIIRAPHVIIYAIGETLLIAEQFASMLSKLSIHTIIAGQYGDYASTAHLTLPGDVALFVSYSGKILGQDAFKLSLDLLKERGCVACLAASEEARNLDLSGFDHTILFGAREDTEGAIGPFYSSECIRMILNCVYARVYALDFPGHDAAKLTVDRLSH